MFTRAIMQWFSRQQPSISVSEEKYLETGNAWWAGELFTGKPNWQTIIEVAQPQLSAKEQAFLDHETEELCRLLNDWEINHRLKNLPFTVWEYIKKHRFWGMIIPTQYNGLGFSAAAHAAVIAKLASRNFTAAITVMVPNSLGTAEFLTQFGTEEQKNYYLPRLVTGEEVSCFGLTSPEAGSDALSIIDKGEVCYGTFKGEQVLGIKINFSKRYITLAPIATIAGIIFHLYDPNHHLGEQEYVGMTIAVIPTDLPGVKKGARHYPLHNAFLNGTIGGEDVFIPIDYVIGGREQCGQGWSMIVECLSVGRGISLPSVATGISKFLTFMTGKYISLRQQFGHPLCDFEGVSSVYARMAGLTYMISAVSANNALATSLGMRPSITAAISKYHLTEAVRFIINSAFDLHGGKAIQMGPRNYLAQFYDCAPINVTVEGANILTRNLIIFGQGLVQAHPLLLQEMHAVKQNDLPRFRKLLWRHVGLACRNFVKTFWYGITAGRMIAVGRSKSPLNYYFKQLTRLSNALLLTTDLVLLVYRKSIKRREAQSARLGDVLSYLYITTAVLKYYHDNKDDTQISLATWVGDFCLAKIAIALQNFFANFQPRWLGRVYQWIIFPWGCGHQMPTDQANCTLVNKLLNDDVFAHKLATGIYFPTDNDPYGYGLRAWQLWKKQVEQIFAKIKTAVAAGRLGALKNADAQFEAAYVAGIIDENEYQAYLAFKSDRDFLTDVDTFTFELDKEA